MKKFLLLIGLSVLSFATFAEKVPSVVITKQGGGLPALLNLYNYVTFTPAELTSTGVAELCCRGSGFSACRVPNCSVHPVNVGTSVEYVTSYDKVNAFNQAINDIILQYEVAMEENENAIQAGGSPKALPSVFTKTIAFSSTGNEASMRKHPDTYVVRGVVTKVKGKDSTMKIYIEKTNIFSVVG